MDDVTQPPAIDYEAARLPRPRPIGPALWLSLWLAVDTIVVSAVFLSAARFERIFRDRNVDLPLMSMIWLRFARWFLLDYGCLYVWGTAASAIVLILIFRPTFLARDRATWLRRAQRVLLHAGWIVPLTFGVLAALLPMVSIWSGVPSKQ